MKIVLCDSTTVNSYGFRTDVSGINLSRFNKNPVMLYNHDPERIIGRWEHVKTDGNQLIGEPVFDMEDPFAAEIARKVEQGFIKGCSMGLVIKSLAQSKGIDIATNSVLIEASIVGIPSDENALVVYDDEENKKKLSINEFNKLFYQMENKETTTPIDNEQLTIDNLQTELAAKTDIIADLSAQVDELKKQLAERDFREAEAHIQSLIEAGHISEDVKSIALAFYLSNPEDTDKLLQAVTSNAAPKHETKTLSISEILNNSKPVSGSATWDDLDKQGKLQQLKTENIEEFKRLYREKFHCEWERF